MKPHFREGTSARDIALAGWSCGFKLKQTMEELEAQGYTKDAKAIARFWGIWDRQYLKDTGQIPM